MNLIEQFFNNRIKDTAKIYIKNNLHKNWFRITKQNGGRGEVLEKCSDAPVVSISICVQFTDEMYNKKWYETFDWLIDDVGPLQHVVSVVKGKTDLPCDVAAPVPDDTASLVLFYKDDASPSIYT